MPELSFFGEIDEFGVAFREFQPGWHHAAVVFTEVGTPGLRMLHLAGNYDFRNDPLESEYKLVPCPYFSPDELELLSVLAARMWKKIGRGMPYNFDYDGAEAFDIDLSFLSENGRGLTCATFVLAFFNNYGLSVVDVPSWKFRPEDAVWQKVIFEYYEQKLSPEHAARMKKNVGSAARFRPEEVVACVNRYVGAPILFDQGMKLGASFMAELHGVQAAV